MESRKKLYSTFSDATFRSAAGKLPVIGNPLSRASIHQCRVVLHVVKSSIGQILHPPTVRFVEFQSQRRRGLRAPGCCHQKAKLTWSRVWGGRPPSMGRKRTGARSARQVTSIAPSAMADTTHLATDWT